jgi:hypothetical protein
MGTPEGPYITASWDGGALSAKLAAEFPPGPRADTNFALDVTFDPVQHAWKGDYTHDGVTREVHFVRPAVLSPAKPSPFVGTWLFTEAEPRPFPVGMRPLCLSVAQSADGVFTEWQSTRGIGRAATGADPAFRSVGDDGGIEWAVTVDGDTLTLDSALYYDMLSGGGGAMAGPPPKFIGKISADGTEIDGKFGSTPDASMKAAYPMPTALLPRPAAMKRMADVESCVEQIQAHLPALPPPPGPQDEQ